jgi:hypothetical protein
MRYPEHPTGEVGFIIGGRERVALQHVGGVYSLAAFMVSDQPRLARILSSNRKIRFDSPRFGPQDFDVAGFEQAQQVYLGCVNG